MNTLEIILLVIYFVGIIPFMAIFKVADERTYSPYKTYILCGFIWPLALIFYIVGQLLFVIGIAIGNFYDWWYNWLNRHIKTK